ncbi:MAG: PAS domain-containing protein [Proteobacteria bacterium]|nr:PAS domain-containing protein [Pseudomonadota bacterium]
MLEHIETTKSITAPSLLSLRDYWVKARGEREFPARKDIDPLHIPKVLPVLTLVDVSHDPLRFRYRLIGTKITEMAKRDATGKWLDEDLYGDRTDDMLWIFRTCSTEKAPIAVRENIQFIDKSWVLVEALAVPLGETDERVDIIMICVEVVDNPKFEHPQDTSFLLNWRA